MSSIVPEALSKIKQLCVIGSGQMGIGIGLVAARYAKVQVQFIDNSQTQLETGIKFIGKCSLLDKDIAKERLTPLEKTEILNRFTTISDMKDIKSPDFVIEAVSENLNIKSSIFEQVSKLVPRECILASNTSSISITKLASFVPVPENFIGMHFMNPVPVMKLVEIIPGLQTSSETLNITKQFAQIMGKTVTVSVDSPGFIANRLLMPYINEAVIALQDGIASKEDIDTTMKLGTNVPMGPLTLADFIGLDTCLAIMNVLHSQLGDSKYRPAVLLQKYVDAGWLGKKSDFAKAYDKVSHKDNNTLNTICGAWWWLLKLVQRLFKKPKMTVRIGDQLLPNVPYKCGLRES
ncbi:hypothetical protein BB561_003944 [Smittium simulii]|uniref:3-hydroxybutyryl-CoA dehydrogenase n=1 Tax=Smittium simulii TaxID=133385 RepID=A0A2T9YIU6_9FUNG|nr:hypothetical protein BB561_003944 [Smittium simulii]